MSLYSNKCTFCKWGGAAVSLTWACVSSELMQEPLFTFQMRMWRSLVPPPDARMFGCQGHQAKAWIRKHSGSVPTVRSSCLIKQLVARLTDLHSSLMLAPAVHWLVGVPALLHVWPHTHKVVVPSAGQVTTIRWPPQPTHLLRVSCERADVMLCHTHIMMVDVSRSWAATRGHEQQVRVKETVTELFLWGLRRDTYLERTCSFQVRLPTRAVWLAMLRRRFWLLTSHN